MNAPLLSTPRVEPFFFDAEPGTRFSVYHAPNPQVEPRGAILYVHPFAEEMNKTRRLAALQSRAFAALGFAVLQFDLFGCGDSCGDFYSGRWELWKSDLSIAAGWLAQRTGGPLWLWGARLGGLLALDCARELQPAGIILWQPFTNGRNCINQFLRLRLAAQMQGTASGTARSTAALRAQLAVHGHIEVGGYEVAIPLVKAVDACDALNLRLPSCEVHWFANPAPTPARLTASVARHAAAWSRDGVQVHFHPVEGPAAWNPLEVIESAALLDATSAVFRRPE
jgi:exosortase A-associated hydrolase 2